MVIEIDFRSGVPVPRQIADAIIIRALTGVLTPGSPLPDVRELSLQLQVNPNSVERAYRILRDSGIARQTAGAWAIADRLPASEAGTEPIQRSMRRVIERGLRIGISRDELHTIFARALEDTDGGD